MEIVDLTKFDSIWAAQPSEKVSDKYSFIKTGRVVEDFMARGWLPVSAGQVAVRKKHREGVQRHLVRLRHRNAVPTKGGAYPEIVLVNSHDGSARFKLMLGLFRLACANGLIVSEESFASYQIKHVGYKQDEVRRAVEYVGDMVPDVLERIKDYQEARLFTAGEFRFGRAALEMRYGKTELYRFSVGALMTPIRPSEQEPTLWNAYNIVQEKFEKGDAYIFNTRKKGQVRRSRPIKSVSETVRINRGLWNLMESEAAKLAA